MRTKTLRKCQDIKDKPLWKAALRLRKFWCFVLMTQRELESHAEVETERQRQFYNYANDVGGKRGKNSIPYKSVLPHL